MTDCACCGVPYSLGDTRMCFDCLADFLEEMREDLLTKEGQASEAEVLEVRGV